MLIDVTITNWEKYNPRSDRKNFTWFRFENSFFGQKVFGITDSQVTLFCLILCEASKKNSSAIKINTEYVSAIRQKSESQILEDLHALNRLELLTTSLTALNDGVKPSYERTNETNVRNERDEELTLLSTDADDQKSQPPYFEIFELWKSQNVLRGIQSISDRRKSKARSQWKKYPDLRHWEDALAKFTGSQFCREKWKPGIDEFLDETKRLRALEGGYDDKKQFSKNAHLLQKGPL